MGRGITGWSFPQDGEFDLGNAIPPFVGDEIAVLLVEYRLICAGEVEVEVDRSSLLAGVKLGHSRTCQDPILSPVEKQRQVKEIY